MEAPSWSLRIALLAIGLLIVAGLYLFAQWTRRRESNRRYGRLRDGWPRRRGEFEQEESNLGNDEADTRAAPEDDFEIVVLKPRERVVDLPAVTHEVAAPSVQNPLPAPTPVEATPEPPPIPSRAPVEDSEHPPMPTTSRSRRKRRSNQLSLGFGDEDEPATSPEPVRPPAPPPEVLALYLRPPRDGVFAGPALAEAFAAVGLRFGEMNIYHHFGAGDLRSERALFSLANMFEPGHFEPDAFDHFTTQGLALFIQFPAALDGSVAFEMFLNVAQRLAESLQAELLSEPRKALDSLTIERMRRIAARYVPQ